MSFTTIFFGTLTTLSIIGFATYKLYEYLNARKEPIEIDKSSVAIFQETEFTRGHVLGYVQKEIPTTDGQRKILWFYPFEMTEEEYENPKMIPYVVGRERLMKLQGKLNGSSVYWCLPRDQTQFNLFIKNSPIGDSLQEFVGNRIVDDKLIEHIRETTSYSYNSLRNITSGESEMLRQMIIKNEKLALEVLEYFKSKTPSSNVPVVQHF